MNGTGAGDPRPVARASAKHQVIAASDPLRVCEPAGQLAAVAGARDAWLTEATAVLSADRRVAGTVVVGSLAAGGGDAFSDVDLIVVLDPPIPPVLLADPVGGLDLPGVELYHRPKPRKAPAGGGYLAVAVELAGLPVLVDMYLWPATTAAVPAGGRVLTERTRLPTVGCACWTYWPPARRTTRPAPIRTIRPRCSYWSSWPRSTTPAAIGAAGPGSAASCTSATSPMPGNCAGCSMPGWPLCGRHRGGRWPRFGDYSTSYPSC